MKFMMNLILFSACTIYSMEQPVTQIVAAELGPEFLSRVPSLRLMSFQAVQKMRLMSFQAVQKMRSLPWKVEQKNVVIIDIIQAEGLDSDLFEKARLVEKFKLKDFFDSVTKELASYIDSHASAKDRKKIVIELATLSNDMQRAIQRLRKS